MPADMGVVATLARALAAHVNDPDPGDALADLIRDGCGPDRWFECFVAELDGEVVGFATACRRFEAHTRQRRLWIGDLYVSPAARGRQAGRALVDALRDRAHTLGCAGLIWDLWRPNATARGFYERVGAAVSDDIVPMSVDL